MRQMISQIATACLALLIVACDYEPEGVNPVEVAEFNVEDLGLTLTVDNVDDTIYVYDKQHALSYSFKITNSQVEEIRFFFDGQEVHNDLHYGYERAGRFWLKTDELTDGVYHLEAKLEVVNTANTVVGVYGDEALTLLYRWAVVVKKDEPVEITSIEPYKGALKVSWKPYLWKNFNAYVVYRYDPNEYRGTDSEPIAIITDRETPEYVDRSYSGGLVRYQVFVKYQSDRWLRSEEVHYADSSVIFYPTKVSGDTPAVSWSKSKYHANFEYYALYKAGKDEWGDVTYRDLVAKIYEVEDTVYLDEDTLPFGRTVFYQMFVNKEVERYTDDPDAETKEVFLGKVMGPFYKISHRPAVQSLYLVNDSSTYRMDNNTYEVVNTSDFEYRNHLTISENATIAYCFQGLDLLSIDPLDLSAANTTSLKGFIREDFSAWGAGLSSVWIGNNNYLFLEATVRGHYNYPYRSPRKTIEILDVEKRKSHYVFEDPFSSFTMSSDGAFFAIDHTVYRLTRDSVQMIGSFSVSGNYVMLNDSNKPDQFVVVDDEQIRIFSWSEAASLGSTNLVYPLQRPIVDAATGYLGGLSRGDPSKYLIYNPQNGKLLRQVEVAVADNYSDAPSYYFFNSAIFSSDGFSLPLEF